MLPLFNEHSAAFWCHLDNSGLPFRDSLSWWRLERSVLSNKVASTLNVFWGISVCSTITTRPPHRLFGSLCVSAQCNQETESACVSKTERPHDISLTIPFVPALVAQGDLELASQSHFLSFLCPTPKCWGYSVYHQSWLLFSFLKNLVLLIYLYVYMSLSLCVCAPACGCSRRPEEGIRSLELELLPLVNIWYQCWELNSEYLSPPSHLFSPLVSIFLKGTTPAPHNFSSSFLLNSNALFHN